MIIQEINQGFLNYMSSILTIILFIIGIAFAVWFIVLRQGKIGFWKLAAKYPNEAYDWFMNEDCWVIIDPQSGLTKKPELRDFNGPFWLLVPKLGGRKVTIYGRFDEIEESQKRFMELYG